VNQPAIDQPQNLAQNQAPDPVKNQPVPDDAAVAQNQPNQNFNDDDLEMSDDRLDENGADWIQYVEQYCVHKGYPEARKLGLMKVLLTGNAHGWLETLADANKNTIAALIEAFKARYKPPDTIKFKSAKELYSRRQKDDETVYEYIELMRKCWSSDRYQRPSKTRDRRLMLATADKVRTLTGRCIRLDQVVSMFKRTLRVQVMHNSRPIQPAQPTNRDIWCRNR